MDDIYASSGPVSTLPGNTVNYSGDCKCERCEKPATKRVQGETDSMGCEYLYLCNECADKIRNEVDEYYCDWCGKFAVVSPMRDIDEGMAGPVYHVCSDCRDKENDRIAKELAQYDDY